MMLATLYTVVNYVTIVTYVCTYPCSYIVTHMHVCIMNKEYILYPSTVTVHVLPSLNKWFDLETYVCMYAAMVLTYEIPLLCISFH